MEIKDLATPEQWDPLSPKDHQIIMRNEDSPQIQQTSLTELHRPNT
jgi:hypothetical protein